VARHPDVPIKPAWHGSPGVAVVVSETALRSTLGRNNSRSR
jgi:hypothetical protein